MPDINPGIRAAGAQAGAAHQAMLTGTPLPTQRFGVNSQDLQTLHQRLGVVITDITKLERAIESLTGKLSKAGDQFERLGGGKGTSSSGGSTITAGTLSGAPGGTGRALTYGVLSELGTQNAGRINTAISSLQAGGLPIDLLARQINPTFGRGTGQNGVNLTVGQFSRLQNMSSADLSQALALLRTNPQLFAPGRLGGSIGFMNQLQSLNPLLGAQGSAQVATQLGSMQTQNMLMMYGGPKAGLINAVTGRQNSPNQVFRSLLTTGSMGFLGANPTAGAARRLAGNANQWAAVQYNLLNMGVPLPMIQELQQYAGAGMNLSAAKPNNAVAGSLLGRTTAGTATGLSVFESSAEVQNRINQIMTGLQGVTNEFVKLNPMLVGFGFAGAQATKYVFSLGAAALEATAALQIIRGNGASGVIGSGAGGSPGATGMFARMKGLPAGVKYGGAAALAGTAASVAGQYIPGTAGKVVSKLGSVAMGAGTGAMLGAMIPGLGEIGIGEIGGAIIGGALGFLGDPVPGPGRTDGMHPALKSGLAAMARDNPNLQLNSGTRTNAEQAALYMLKGGKQVAKPGQSKHQRGQAADVGPPSQLGWVTANASRYGLYNPSSSEPWHLEAMGDVTAGSVGLVNSFVSQVNTLGSTFGLGTSPGAHSTVTAAGSTGTTASTSPTISGSSASSMTMSAGSTAIVPGNANDKSITSPTQFSQAVLRGLGLGATQADVIDLNAWQQREGQWTATGIYNSMQMHDPLNTKLNAFGGVPIGGGATDSYPNWPSGVSATVATIRQGNMAPIFSALKANANLASFTSALEGTGWAQSKYGGTGFPSPSGVYAVGDPTGASISRPRTPGKGGITINMPLQVVGVSQEDAQRLAQMVIQRLQQSDVIAAMGQS